MFAFDLRAGDPEQNRKAVEIILRKIAEDPQSSSCPMISYQDYSGPVPNAYPTGSPYATPISAQGGAAAAAVTSGGAASSTFGAAGSGSAAAAVQAAYASRGAASPSTSSISTSLNVGVGGGFNLASIGLGSMGALSPLGVQLAQLPALHGLAPSASLHSLQGMAGLSGTASPAQHLAGLHAAGAIQSPAGAIGPYSPLGSNTLLSSGLGYSSGPLSPGAALASSMAGLSFYGSPALAAVAAGQPTTLSSSINLGSSWGSFMSSSSASNSTSITAIAGSSAAGNFTVAGGPVALALTSGTVTQTVIESFSTMLKSSGYSDQATDEILAALCTLANYGVLNLSNWSSSSGMFQLSSTPPGAQFASQQHQQGALLQQVGGGPTGALSPSLQPLLQQAALPQMYAPALAQQQSNLGMGMGMGLGLAGLANLGLQLPSPGSSFSLGAGPAHPTAQLATLQAAGVSPDSLSLNLATGQLGVSPAALMSGSNDPTLSAMLSSQGYTLMGPGALDTGVGGSIAAAAGASAAGFGADAIAGDPSAGAQPPVTRPHNHQLHQQASQGGGSGGNGHSTGADCDASAGFAAADVRAVEIAEAHANLLANSRAIDEISAQTDTRISLSKQGAPLYPVVSCVAKLSTVSTSFYLNKCGSPIVKIRVT